MSHSETDFTRQELELKLAPEIAERQSLTNWSDQKITPEVWELLLEAARLSPSSWNHQPARYIVIQEKQAQKRLCECLHRTNAWAEKAAGLVVQVASPEDDDRMDGKDYYLYDCGLSMMSLIYQAQSLGITARQMIGWNEIEIKTLLQIPDRYRVVVITGLGYPSDSSFSAVLANAKRRLTQQHKRYSLENIAYWQIWGGSMQ